MKSKFLILFLLTIGLISKLSAQCADCEESDGWKFAAGVTLYSNNRYVSEYDIFLERQPLEFNFRYKLNENHVLRLNLPMAWKVNYSTDPQGTYPQFEANTGNKANDYYEGMKNDYWYYADFFKVKDYYYNLFGVSAGYSFNHYLFYGLSMYIGIDFGYVHHSAYSNYYHIGYTALDNNNTSELRAISYVERVNCHNTYSTKPLLGINFQYKNLLFDISGGYSLSTYKLYGTLNTLSPEAAGMHIGPFERDFKSYKQFVYQLSLFYIF